MTQGPDQNQKPEREWGKLSPAISSPTADSLLSARRKESIVPTEAPAPGAETPWTSSIPAVASHRADALEEHGQSAEQETTASLPAEASTAEAPTTGGSDPAPQPLAASIATAEEASVRAEARETAVEDRPRWLAARTALIALAVPLLTLLTAVRLIATHGFLWAEYHRPGFPADSYGFDTQERLRLGSYGLDYILNFAPHTYLSEIETGGATAFLASEVEHMTDVKRVMLIALTAGALLFIAALCASRSLRTRAPGAIRKSLFTGSWLTLGILVALLVIGLLGWEPLFTAFHQLFFPQGNWQFRMSDTLIRLYPPQFWVDAALAIAILTLLFSLVLMMLTWPTQARKQRALARRAQRQELQRKLSQ